MAQAASGLIFRSSCDQISAPETGTTLCMRTVPTYALYVWDGTAWAPMAAATPLPQQVASGTFLLSGGAVAWVSGLTFTVSPAVYYIDFNRYNSQQQNVTLPPADPVNDRIDAIVLKTDTTLDVVTGTAGAPPFQPFVDPTLYLAITYVYVP